MWTKVKWVAIGFVVLLAISSSLYAWYRVNNIPAQLSKIEYVKVPQIKIVEKIKKVSIPGPKEIVTIEKQVIVEKLKMPEWAEKFPNEQAIATAVIPSYEGKTNVVSTIDASTGIGSILVKREPLPLFDFLNDREVGIRAGYNTKAKQEATVYGEWDFLRVGSVKIGIYGDATSEGDARLQLKIGFRF